MLLRRRRRRPCRQRAHPAFAALTLGRRREAVLIEITTGAAGVCDILCSDYLPSSLVAAPFALDASGVADLGSAVDLVGANPAAALGLGAPTIAVGVRLNASLRRAFSGVQLGLALWSDGRLVFTRSPLRRR